MTHIHVTLMEYLINRLEICNRDQSESQSKKDVETIFKNGLKAVYDTSTNWRVPMAILCSSISCEPVRLHLNSAGYGKHGQGSANSSTENIVNATEAERLAETSEN